ncbi:LOW QUALITY PROTEIN: inositol 1,4,5-trisphosphate receptor-interacting protein-like 1 [Melozone crissalis]|uniref:LOW QUALITY PROTEIN: inositol 1,4,5-trisphosphate receptor-interacting protein-like 1 n=1 Tax=Melozone crissalis TaxID=40204 RepID=UPI0023DAF4BD|nr:LOW QUALITY PROTEIN: inositol 1,4,5-trisphosphate receptor-interacting protein-like 1 [Melozone crissalis]
MKVGPIPDALLGFGTPGMNLLHMQNAVLLCCVGSENCLLEITSPTAAHHPYEASPGNQGPLAVAQQEPQCDNGGSCQEEQQVTLPQCSLGERRVSTQTGGCAERGERPTAETRVFGERLLSLTQYPQQAGDGLDEATLERMQQRAEYLEQQMTQLIQELEQMNRCDRDKGGHKERSSSNLVKEEERRNVVGNVEKGNVDDKQEMANGEEDDGNNVQRKLGSLLEERIEEFPVLDLDKGFSMITDLVDKLIHVFGEGLSNSFYPVPQPAMGIGSAFEGCGPHAQDVVHRLLVPLSPPPGHAFHLELDTAGGVQRNFCVRVERVCTCRRERLEEDMLCFLHHPEEELRRKQDPSLLHTLCTGCCLDVEKTVHWFYGFVRVAWLLLPESCHWRLRLQPSSRSCKFQLSKDKESFTVEMFFAVRQGDSDVFVSSQPTEVGIPSTTWLETYAVAEAKFFRHISRRSPRLQLLTGFLMGVGFSSCVLMTVVTHLLSTVPLTGWGRSDFGQRVMAILKSLRCSLEIKQLHHFVIGNASFPTEISLPSGFQVAVAPNVLEHLARSPDTHRKAVQDHNCLNC